MPIIKVVAKEPNQRHIKALIGDISIGTGRLPLSTKNRDNGRNIFNSGS